MWKQRLIVHSACSNNYWNLVGGTVHHWTPPLRHYFGLFLLICIHTSGALHMETWPPPDVLKQQRCNGGLQEICWQAEGMWPEIGIFLSARLGIPPVNRGSVTSECRCISSFLWLESETLAQVILLSCVLAVYLNNVGFQWWLLVLRRPTIDHAPSFLSLSTRHDQFQRCNYAKLGCSSNSLRNLLLWIIPFNMVPWDIKMSHSSHYLNDFSSHEAPVNHTKRFTDML